LNRFVRTLGPISDAAPPFPTGLGPLLPLRASAEAQGSPDFTPLYAGQAASLARALPAYKLTRLLADEALQRLNALGGSN
jgi:nitronate monooxygenase